MTALDTSFGKDKIRNLPNNWIELRLEEVLENHRGGVWGIETKPGIGYPVLRSTNMRGSVLDFSETAWCDVSKDQAEIAKLMPGDIIVTKSSGSPRLVGLPVLFENNPDGKTYLFSNFTLRLRPNFQKIFPKLLFYFLSGEKATIDRMGMAQDTTGLRNLKVKEYLSQKIPIPPLDEQQRLITKLESILAQTSTARTALECIPPLLKTFRQSVLVAAFRGELTERDSNDEPAEALLERIRAERRKRWKESLRVKGKDPAKFEYEEPSVPDTSNLPELPEGWMWTALDQLLDRIEAGHSFKAQGRPAEDREFGVIKVSAMTWGRFIPEENKALLPETDPGNTPTIHKGDLLISRANTVELVGAVVLVDKDYPNLLLSDKSLRLVPITEEISKEFLLFALRTHPVRKVFEGEATGVSESMRNITQEKIKSAPIALPPVQEQIRIIEKIQKSYHQIDAIERACISASRRLNELEQATLSKAYRGKMV